MSLGLVHAALLRAAVREQRRARGARDAFDEAPSASAPWYRATVAFDHARLAEIDGVPRGAEPPAPPLGRRRRVRAALPLAMTRDPEVFRAGLEITSCLALPHEVFARPGIAQRVLEAAGDGSGR